MLKESNYFCVKLFFSDDMPLSKIVTKKTPGVAKIESDRCVKQIG